MDTATRRKLLQTGLAAALLAAGGVPVAAGARDGGRLRIGLSGVAGPHRWAPHRGFGVFQSLTGAGLLFDTLTEIAPDGLLRGALATAWTPSDRGRVWTLDLDPAARFHTGRALSAEDVIASLDLHLAAGAPGHGLRALIARFVPLSDHRLRITLHAPNPDFPYLLSDPVLLIGPADDLDRAFAEGIGTGPYRLRSLDGNRLLAERCCEAPGTRGGNWFETVEVLSLPDAAVRVSTLGEGRVDVIDRVPGDGLSRLARGRGADVIPLPGTEFIQISVGGALAPAEGLVLIAGLRAAIDCARLAACGPFQPVLAPVPAEAPPGWIAAFGKAPVRLAMDPDLGEDGARLTGALVAPLRALGLTPTLADDAASAHLHLSRRPVRPTPDWTCLTALLGAPEVKPVLPRATSAETLARLAATGPNFVPVIADANLVVSGSIGRPKHTGEGWDLAHARLSRRWWRA